MENSKVDRKVEEAMNSLAGLQRAAAGDLFFERVMMKMEKPDAKVVSIAPRLLLQAAACLAALITLNVFVWLKSDTTAETQKTEQKNPVAQEYFSYLNNLQF